MFPIFFFFSIIYGSAKNPGDKTALMQQIVATCILTLLGNVNNWILLQWLPDEYK